MTDRKISSYILPTSATMVGVCMTVLSLAKVVEAQTHAGRVDEIMALDSLIFLTSAFCSYLALRSERDSTRLERIADRVFMFGLTVMVGAAVVFAMELH
jgi:hypothetical protein